MKDFLCSIGRYFPVRTLDRYIMKQFIISYAIVTSCLLLLFVVLDGVSRLKRFMRHDDGLILVLIKYFSATIPIYYSQYLGPVLTLIAAMFTITTLNKGQELVPMKATGLSIHRILLPCFLMAFLLGLFQVAIQEWVLPNCKTFIREGKAIGKGKNLIRPDLVPDSQLNLLFSIGEYDPIVQKGFDVTVKESHAGTSRYKAILQAEDIVWQPETKTWLLRTGMISTWDINGNSSKREAFSSYSLRTNMRPIDLESNDQQIPYLSYGELLDQYWRHQELNHLEVKLHQRFAFPVANVILLLLGLPFVLRGHNQSLLIGVGIAVLISGGYLLSTMICVDLGNNNSLKPAVAAWLPVLFFGALGLTLFDNIET